MNNIYSKNYDINKLQTNTTQAFKDVNIQFVESKKRKTIKVSEATLITKDNEIIIIDSTNAYNLTLPKPVDRFELPLMFRIISGTANVVLVPLSGNINGSTSLTMASGGVETLFLVSDGNNYWSI